MVKFIKYCLLLLFVFTSVSFGKLHTKEEHFVVKEIWIKPEQNYATMKLFHATSFGASFWTKIVESTDNAKVHFNGPSNANYLRRYYRSDRDYYCSLLVFNLKDKLLGTYEICICARVGGYTNRNAITKEDYIWVKIHVVNNIPPKIL